MTIQHQKQGSDDTEQRHKAYYDYDYLFISGHFQAAALQVIYWEGSLVTMVCSGNTVQWGNSSTLPADQSVTCTHRELALLVQCISKLQSIFQYEYELCSCNSLCQLSSLYMELSGIWFPNDHITFVVGPLIFL